MLIKAVAKRYLPLIIWILFPTVLVALGFVLQTLAVTTGGQNQSQDYISYVYGMFVAACVATEIFIIRRAILKKEGYFALIFLGAAVQFLIPASLLVALLLGAGSQGENGFGLGFLVVILGFIFVSISVAELVTLLLTTVTLFILRKQDKMQYAPSLLVMEAVVVFVVLGVIVPLVLVNQVRDSELEPAYLSLEYDSFDKEFREPEKQTTQLGTLPRPLGVVRRDDSFFALTADEDFIPLTFMEGLNPDSDRKIYFDVFTDHVYYVTAGEGYDFDLSTGTATLLPSPIQNALEETNCDLRDPPPCSSKREFVSAHNDQVALGTFNDVAVFDMNTGERLHQTTQFGSDFSSMYFFWIGDRGYRLVSDYHPLLATRPEQGNNDETLMNILRFYLEDHPDAYHLITQAESGPDYWGNVIYGGGVRSFYFDGKTPILTLKTLFPSVRRYDDNQAKFSVREFYQLDELHVALEVEDKLIVINLVSREVESITDQTEIASLLIDADLLSSDRDIFLQSTCLGGQSLDSLIRDGDYTFVTCIL